MAPPISTPELGPMLPSESPRDENVVVNVEPATSSTGTAFAINDTGQWMTARHVVDSCTDIGLKIGAIKTLRVKAVVSKEADLAILSSDWSRTPLPHDLNSQRQIGEAGYFFGFPQGRPGEAIGKLLGRNRMVVRGRYRSNEAILAWSEIGVVTAENPRRGRIYTVAPTHLRQHIKSQSTRPEPLELNAYGSKADKLRRDRRKASCASRLNYLYFLCSCLARDTSLMKKSRHNICFGAASTPKRP